MSHLNCLRTMPEITDEAVIEALFAQRPYEEKVLNSAYLEIPAEYQRELSIPNIERMSAEFTEWIANPPKVSYRDGHYYVFDGQHTLMTRKAMNGGADLPIICKVYYGLTQEEEAILFSRQTGVSAPLTAGAKLRAALFGKDAEAMEVKRIVTQASIDGKKVLVQADRAKTKSSLRTLPLVPPIRDRLLELKGQQETYRRLCRSSYNPDYLGYLCVDEIGNILRPNYVSEQFPKLLEKNGLRPIRFHDLRHSCASLLLANGVPMKQIQEWLGHSDFSTTANIYAHLDYASKLSSAQAMLECLGYGNASA